MSRELANKDMQLTEIQEHLDTESDFSVSMHAAPAIYDVHLLFVCCCSIGGAGGLVVRRMTCDHIGRGFESHRGHLQNNFGQVVHTYVLLSTSRLTWYWSKNGDFFWLGR